jgi:hypothetical protein
MQFPYLPEYLKLRAWLKEHHVEFPKVDTAENAKALFDALDRLAKDGHEPPVQCYEILPLVAYGIETERLRAEYLAEFAANEKKWAAPKPAPEPVPAPPPAPKCDESSSLATRRFNHEGRGGYGLN